MPEQRWLRNEKAAEEQTKMRFDMSVIAMKQLLEAGVHCGHQTRRSNPIMGPYIYTERNGIYIIDLQKSVGKVDEAYNAIRDCVANGGYFRPTVRLVGNTLKMSVDNLSQFSSLSSL